MYGSTDHETPPRAPVTVPGLRAMKAQGRPIVALTAYDASFAALLDGCGVDVVLVGDSLGMVVQGHHSTLAVSVSDMVYHAAAVRRGLSSALLLADLPFLSYRDRAHALDAAGRLLAEAGAQMVKLEGGGFVCDRVNELVEQGIPVCGHLGLTPQWVHKLGGYRVQAREVEAQDALLVEARRLDQAGADLLVLECVPATLAGRVRAAVSMPVIGIGAGLDCDGQVLVLHDMLGITPGKRPRFSKDFLAEAGTIAGAVRAYVEAVRQRRFPGPEHAW